MRKAARDWTSDKRQRKSKNGIVLENKFCGIVWKMWKKRTSNQPKEQFKRTTTKCISKHKHTHTYINTRAHAQQKPCVMCTKRENLRELKATIWKHNERVSAHTHTHTHRPRDWLMTKDQREKTGTSKNYTVEYKIATVTVLSFSFFLFLSLALTALACESLCVCHTRARSTCTSIHSRVCLCVCACVPLCACFESASLVARR